MPAKRHTKQDCPFSDEIAVLLADQNRMKEDLADIKKDLKDFIEKADKVYAKKEEVNELKQQLKETKNTLWSLAREFGPPIVIVIFVVLEWVIK